MFLILVSCVTRVFFIKEEATKYTRFRSMLNNSCWLELQKGMASNESFVHQLYKEITNIYVIMVLPLSQAAIFIVNTLKSLLNTMVSP